MPLSLGPPLGSHQKSTNLKLGSKATKDIKLIPKIIRTHTTLTLGSTDCNMYEKLFFVIHPLFFLYSRHSDSDPKIIRKSNLAKHERKQIRWSKALKNLSKLGPEVHPETITIIAWTPKCRFFCCQMPQDRSMATQCAKVEAQRMPNDRSRRFGH